jgi:hypothetical protein
VNDDLDDDNRGPGNADDPDDNGAIDSGHSCRGGGGDDGGHGGGGGGDD